MEAVLVPWVAEVSLWSWFFLSIAAGAHSSAAGHGKSTELKDEGLSLVLGFQGAAVVFMCTTSK